MCFIFFSCLMALARFLRTLLTISGRRVEYSDTHNPRSQELEEGGLGFFANLVYIVVQVPARIVSKILSLIINDNTNIDAGEKGCPCNAPDLGLGTFSTLDIILNYRAFMYGLCPIRSFFFSEFNNFYSGTGVEANGLCCINFLGSYVDRANFRNSFWNVKPVLYTWNKSAPLV